MYEELPVNFHLERMCNMACGYCFNRGLSAHSPPPSRKEQIAIVRLLCSYGFSKISFVGGEPTLCPWLPELLQVCREHGVTSMLITNGSKLEKSPHLLDACDWVGLSIDSFHAETNQAIGRGAPEPLDYDVIIDLIKKSPCRLKINTVVSRLNMTENMTDSIAHAVPERWKVMQVTKIEGQNSVNFRDYSITGEEFSCFVVRHNSLDKILVKETSDDMYGSYLMIDPYGCFIDNSLWFYKRSHPILSVGIAAALRETAFSVTKFKNRNGAYIWRIA